MSTMASAYRDLEDRFRRMANLGGAIGVLHWDRSTMMPDGGADARADQLATLSVLSHEMMCAPELADLLDAAEVKPDGLDAWQSANLREMRRRWVHANAVPSELVEAMSRAASTCERVWRKARPENNFAAVAPYLEEIMGLTREAGQAKAAALGLPLYDALMDQYEPGARAARIDAIFADLAAFLPGFIDDVLARQAALPPPVWPQAPFPVDKQRRLSRRLCKVIGFDFHHGRLDESAHPFTGGVPDDVRITTRYDKGEFVQAIMATVHETGHALYERGLPEEWRGQPVGRSRGMVLHESQSLLIEMQACRSEAFLGFAGPLMAEAFGGDPETWSVDNLTRIYRVVERGLIRVEADEVTYPAHVIMRYRLEQALMADDLAVREIPGAWAEGLEALLGVRPADDRTGCLQDIHWYDGAVGYFPTYTLGALAAAQLFAAATEQDSAIVPAIERGDFSPLLAWLGSNVHRKASRFTTDEVMEQATGRPLDPKVFERHLRTRYLER